MAAGAARVDGHCPRRRRTEHLQLGQLHQSRPDQEIRGDLQGQGHDHRLRLERHGAGQDPPGGHGFDIVVPSQTYVPIWINEGLLLEPSPDQMPNFKNIDPGMGRCPNSIRAATTPFRGSGALSASSSTPTSTRATSTRSAHPLRSAGRAHGQDQCRARDERRDACRDHAISAASAAPTTRSF